MGMPAYNTQRAEVVTYGCQALVGTNKAGVLKPDKDGYYNGIVLGAFNVFNNGGAYYVFSERVKAMFEKSSQLMRRLADGALRSEYGHPRLLPGMKPSEFLTRVLDIYEPNVCCHIRSVSLDFNQITDKNGQTVVAVLGSIKPMGPMGASLKASLDNPNENVCFSVRSLTDDRAFGGTIQKDIKLIVTWDYVNEPGIQVAKKWNSPSLESIIEQKVTPAQLRLVVDNTRRQGKGMESTYHMAEELARVLGWDKEDPKSPIILPRDLSW
jgi:hypothetical protein